MIKLETFFYQIVKEWCTLVHHEICDCGSFAPTRDLFSSLFTKRLDRWRHVGRGIPTRRSSVKMIF